MTSLGPLPPLKGRQAWRLGALMFLRMALSITLLFAAYYLIPTKSDAGDADLPFLILELIVFGIIVGVQVPAIVTAKYPVLRAIEALAVTVSLFLVIFARIYLENSLNNPSAFSQPLDQTTAFYFTVTVFATVGFGDIVATTNGMKLLVTVQMLLNLVVFGLVIRLLTSAAQRGVAKRNLATPPADGPAAG